MLILNNYIEKTSTGEIKINIPQWFDFGIISNTKEDENGNPLTIRESVLALSYEEAEEIAFEKHKKEHLLTCKADLLSLVCEKDNDKFILYIENGDITPLILMQEFTNLAPQDKDTNEVNLFVPNFPKNKFLLDKMGAELYNEAEINLIVFDNIEDDKGLYKNIIPNFSTYIDKESAILFLNEEDRERYLNDNIDTYFTYPNLKSKKDCLDRDYFNINNHKKLTIITNSIHSENMQEFNKVSKILKEVYKVEHITLTAPHCYIDIDIDPEKWWQDEVDSLAGLCYYLEKWHQFENINKIITTNSTRILEPQKSQHLEVINCEEFFKDLN